MNNPRLNLNATSKERSGGAWYGNGGLSQWGWLEKLKRQKSWLWEVHGNPECWSIKRKTEIWAIYKLKCPASAQLWAPSVGVGKEASHQWTKEPLCAIRKGMVHSVGTQIVLLFWEMSTHQASSTKPWLQTSVHSKLTQGCIYWSDELYPRCDVQCFQIPSLIMTFVHILWIMISVC